MEEVRSFEGWGKEFGVSESVAGLALLNVTHHDPDWDPNLAKRRYARRKLRVLTEEDVIRARKLAVEGVSARDISEMYSVTSSAIIHAVRGTTWAHVPGALPEIWKPYRTELRKNPEAVRLLQERYARGGISTTKLAREYGVGTSTIRNALLFGVVES